LGLVFFNPIYKAFGIGGLSTGVSGPGQTPVDSSPDRLLIVYYQYFAAFCLVLHKNYLSLIPVLEGK
jgi:hypothetical protein